MKPEDIVKLAALYTQKTVSPFDPDRMKGAVSAAFVAGFMTAQGLWKTEFDKLKLNEQEAAPPPPPVTLIKP